MLRQDAHRALSYMLGDPVVVTGSPATISDGVRYSARLRDEYLYRAMLKHIRDSIQQTMAQGGEQHSLLRKIYPTFMQEQALAIPTAQDSVVALNRLCAFFYDAVCNHTVNNVRPLVFTEMTPVKFSARRGMKVNTQADPMYFIKTLPAATASSLQLFLNAADLAWVTANCNQLVVRYLPIPTHPATQAADAALEFEEILMDDILARATLFGRVDSQDMNDLEAFTKVIL